MSGSAPRWTPARAGQRSDLEGTLDSIRRAFLADDAAVIQRQFSTGRPIYHLHPTVRKGRFLGPGPLQSLLDRLVADTETVTFEFTSTGEPAMSPRRDRNWRRVRYGTGRTAKIRRSAPCYVKARWTYVEATSKVRRTLDLYLAIQRQSDGGDWRIVELKAFD